MPNPVGAVPVAATGDCGWCGERALLYFRARDGSDMERPACRPCMEYDCGARARSAAGCESGALQQQQQQQQQRNREVENDEPMGGSEQSRVALQSLAPSGLASHIVAQFESQSMTCSSMMGRPMAFCVAPEQILPSSRKRANGGVALDGMFDANVLQCGSFGPAGDCGGYDTKRGQLKRQRTAFGEL